MLDSLVRCAQGIQSKVSFAHNEPEIQSDHSKKDRGDH